MSSCSTDEFHEKFKNKDYKVYQSLLMSDQNMASSQQDHDLFASDTMKCTSITIGCPLHNFKIKIFSPRKQLVTLQESHWILAPATWRKAQRAAGFAVADSSDVGEQNPVDPWE
jgi:hypothetical protein